jgi:hypothetical protein
MSRRSETLHADLLPPIIGDAHIFSFGIVGPEHTRRRFSLQMRSTPRRRILVA